ncbi:MAG: TldD/PmbA family protein [Propionibacteriales bacterium]|nr:TldD/PmbA family protein [Propionibacteriales bacterium]
MTDLTDIVTGVLEHAVGEEQLEAYAVHRISTTIQAGADAAIRHVGRAETRGLGIRVIRDGRLGYASTSDLDSAAIRLTVERARANAAASDVDQAQHLPTPEVAESAEGFLHPSFAQASLAEKIDLVQDLARGVVSLDRQVKSLDTAEYHDEQRNVAVASTGGVQVVHEAGYVELWADALGEDTHARGSDYAYQFARIPADCDPDSLAHVAVQRTLRLLGPVSPYRTPLPVVLDPAVVADLLSAIGKGLSGGPVSSGRTPFARRAGTTVAAGCVSLADDGWSLSSPEAAAYDDEGLPRRRTQLISDGVLVGALHSTVTAKAAGDSAEPTGNARRGSYKSVPRAAATSLVLEPTISRSELLASVDEAVYIQQLSGSGAGINPVTGRVDVGGVGWLLRNGEVVGRLDTVPIATDLLGFLTSVLAVGDDSYPVPFSSAAASTLLCDSWLIGSDH